MISGSIVSAFAVVAMATMAAAQSASPTVEQIATPSVTLPANAMTQVGCFDKGEPLDDHGPHDFQSPGNCQLICIMLKKPVMALTDGTNCWCGDLIPAKAGKVADTQCDTDCSGTDVVKCGGPKKWMVSLTGTTKNRIEQFDPASVSSSAVPTSTVPKKTDEPEKTLFVTASTSPEAGKSSGPNKAGIAAGVVVGVVVLAAIVAGAILFLRHKKRRELEEEHRRQAAVNSFVSGGKLHTSNSSMTDSRLDPEFMNRRQSNGSIADNEDYSRRILKVTNA